MKVRDYIADMVLGQHFAIEYDDLSKIDEDGCYLRKIDHFIEGQYCKTPCSFDFNVRFFVVRGNEIIFST